MDNRTVGWIQRLLVGAAALAAAALHHFRLSVGHIFVILMPILLLFMMILIYIAPGPRTKGLVDRLKGRPR